MEKTMQRLVDDPEAALRRAADHVLTGYAWFYSDRKVTVPAAATLVRLADEILAERCRWLAILARNGLYHAAVFPQKLESHTQNELNLPRQGGPTQPQVFDFMLGHNGGRITHRYVQKEMEEFVKCEDLSFLSFDPSGHFN